MRKLIFLLLFFSFIGHLIGITLMVDSPTSEVFRMTTLSTIWKIYHIESHAFLELDLTDEGAKLIGYAPEKHVHIKIYKDRYPCPSYVDGTVMTWILAMFPAERAIKEDLDVRKRLKDTGFEDESEESLAIWLSGRKLSDPFATALIYVVNEISRVDELQADAKTAKICKVGGWDLSGNDSSEESDRSSGPGSSELDLGLRDAMNFSTDLSE